MLVSNIYSEPSRSPAKIEMAIDKAGRIVIPLALRERLNLQDGTRLEICLETDDAIVLKVAHEETPTQRMSGVLAFTGKLAKTVAGSDDLVKHGRDERINKLINL
jgi:AbrB family looped-hinge helix DNA binding protein